MRGFLILGLLVLHAHGQSGALDPTFQAEIPEEFQLQAISQQENGRLLLAGRRKNELTVFRLMKTGINHDFFVKAVATY